MKDRPRRSPAEQARAECARDLVSRGEIEPHQAILMAVFPTAKIIAREQKVPPATLRTRAHRAQ